MTGCVLDDSTTRNWALVSGTGAASSRLVIGGANQSATITPARGRFKGEIGLVLTYDRALTKAEMEQTCRAFAARFGITTCPQ